MNHTEKVLGGMLESLFASGLVEESNDENDDGTPTEKKTEDHEESPTNSFLEDISEFFNISKSNSNGSNKSRTSIQDHQEDLATNDHTSAKNVHNRSIVDEIKKIQMEYPLNDESCAPEKFNNETHLDEAPSTSKKAYIEPEECPIDFSQSPGNNAFLNEVKRVLYDVKSSDFPVNSSRKYFDIAQNYAIYGKDFLDFPQDLDDIYRGVNAKKQLKFPQEVHSSSSEDETQQPKEYPYPYHPLATDARFLSKPPEAKASLGEPQKNFTENSIHEPPSYNHNPNNPYSGIGERQTPNNSQLGLAAATSAATAATYYQLCSNLQPSLRPVTVVNSTTSAAASTAATPGYVLLSNRVTYMAHGTHNLHPQQVFFNQQQLSTTTNFYANQAAIGSPPNIRFPNPVVASTTTTQHISNTVYKETQYVANVPLANPAGAANVNAYERLVNAQLVRQVLQTRQQQQQQQQQQALIAAAIYQQQLQRQQHQIRMANSLQSTVLNAVSSTVNSNVSAGNVDRNVGNVVGQTGSIETTCTMLQMQSVDVARVNFNNDSGLFNFPEASHNSNSNNFNSPHQG